MGKLEHRIEKLLTSVYHLFQEGRDAELPHCLGTALDFDQLPHPRACLGLTRTVLLANPSNFTQRCEIITYKIVYELELFRSREGLPHSFLHSWVKQLGLLSLSPSQLQHKLSTVCKQIKDMKKKYMYIDMTDFLNLPIFPNDPPPPSLSQRREE